MELERARQQAELDTLSRFCAGGGAGLDPLGVAPAHRSQRRTTRTPLACQSLRQGLHWELPLRCPGMECRPCSHKHLNTA